MSVESCPPWLSDVPSILLPAVRVSTASANAGDACSPIRITMLLSPSSSFSATFAHVAASPPTLSDSHAVKICGVEAARGAVRGGMCVL
eukprot:2307544-Rhodomonas_salina.2